MLKTKHFSDLSAFAFSIGFLPLLFLPKLPLQVHYYLLIGVFAILVLAKIIRLKYLKKSASFFIFLMIGFVYSTFIANRFINQNLPYIDKNIEVIAQIKSLNLTDDEIKEHQTYRYVDIEIKQMLDNQQMQNQVMSVLWKLDNLPFAGQIWKLKIKTKAIHSYLNEGGFDYQRFSIANKKLINVVVLDANLLNNQITLRQKIVNHVWLYLKKVSNKGLLSALLIGERQHITEDQKNIMSKTATAHLMAISGMHIMLVMFLFSFLTKKAQKILPINRIYFWMPLIVGYLFAAAYAWLSGFNPPVMRALLALTFWLIFKLKYQILTPWQVLNRVIALLLLLDPFMILSESFWLSCYAVICLIFITQWFSFRHGNYFYQLIKLQLVLTLLLLPIQIFIFGGISLSSVIANIFAIPIISFITLPMLLFMLMISFINIDFLTHLLGYIANTSCDILFYTLDFFKDYWLTLPSDYYLLSFMGWFLIVLLKLRLYKRLFIALTVIFLLMISPCLKNDETKFRVDMLDVGHGLAVIIRQGKSAILYDTGASWQSGSAAKQVILPFIHYHDLKIDGIIISHEHNDHIGGLEVIQKEFPNAWLMSSSLALNNDYDCVFRNKIAWNDLTFTALWPKQMNERAYNPESCVIKVKLGDKTLLLTGDLEKEQELQLVKEVPHLLKSTFLQVPHHGSNTSSHYHFLHRVKPLVSFGSASRYNPWRLPSNKALARYKALSLDYYFTHQSGQISIFFYENKTEIKRMRHEIKPRWYHDWFDALPKAE